MNGKISLLLVLGFSALFGIFARNMLSSSNVSVNNYTFYYSKTQANQIAKSGIFYSISKLNNTNPNWTGGNFAFAGGNANIVIQTIGGPNGTRVVTSTGTYGTGDYAGLDTIIVTLRQRSLSEYGNFYNKFELPSGAKVWAATGDVFDGKFHANDFIRCYGNPEFNGEVTTSREIKLANSSSFPIFHEGYKENVPEKPITIDIAEITIAAPTGKTFFDSTGANRFTDVYLKFYADGTVDYKSKIGTGSWSAIKNVNVTDLTNNGLIYIKGGRVSVEGVLNGQVTVVATKNGVTDANAGKVFIPNSISYTVDPLLDYGKKTPPYLCDDVLGLVAEKEVVVPFNNSRGNIKIQASVFSQDGGMRIENYGSYSGINNMNIVGGVIGNFVEPTAKYSTSPPYNPIKGYSYVHKYDSRFDNWAPPFFPKQRLFVPELWYTANSIIPHMYK